MRKSAKILGIMLTVMIMSSSMSGCGNSSKKNTDTTTKNDKSPITFTMFDKNTGDAFTDDIAKEITKITGVTLEIQQPTGNPLEKLNLMLASGDSSDILLMDRGNDIVNKFTSSGQIIDLTELINKYGPNIKKMYGDTLKKIRYQDGKNYYISNWYGMDPSPVFGILMRKDLLKEVGVGAKVDNGQPFTTDEFESILMKVKAKHPTLNGHETIPLTLNGENMGAVTGSFKGMFGMKTYYEDNGTLKYDVKDPKYLDMLKYMNKLYSKGLMDKEWAINKNQLWQQKIANGYTFSTAGAYWDVGASNAILKKTSADSQLYAYKVVAPGIDPSKTTYGGRSTLGWDAIAISKSCKDPIRAIKFLDFLASEKGQYLLMWGKEGTDWTMENGKHTINPNVLQGFKDDWDAYVKKSGIRHWPYCIKNGNGTDGTPYDLAGNQNDEVKTAAMKNLSDSVWDITAYDNLTPESGTPEALNSQKILDIINIGIPQIVYSANEAKAVVEYNKMMTALNNAGIDKVEKIINDNYKKRMELWNK